VGRKGEYRYSQSRKRKETFLPCWNQGEALLQIVAAERIGEGARPEWGGARPAQACGRRFDLQRWNVSVHSDWGVLPGGEGEVKGKSRKSLEGGRDSVYF